MYEKIDTRFKKEEAVILLCNKCGCISATKNIIGANTITPIHVSTTTNIVNHLALDFCNKKEHNINDYRLLNNDEYELWLENKELFVKNNKRLADQLIKKHNN